MKRLYPEPTEIIIGDTITWKRRAVQAISENDNGTIETTDIKASEGWALKFVAVGRLGAITINATADTENANDFSFTAAAATTGAYTAGDYQWQIVATKTTTRYTIATGIVTVSDNIAGRSAAYDNRSHAKKVLDAIEAVLENRASATDQSYTIAGRSITKIPLQDLMRLRAQYKAEYESEVATENIKMGLSGKNKIFTRFI